MENHWLATGKHIPQRTTTCTSHNSSYDDGKGRGTDGHSIIGTLNGERGQTDCIKENGTFSKSAFPDVRKDKGYSYSQKSA